MFTSKTYFLLSIFILHVGYGNCENETMAGCPGQIPLNRHGTSPNGDSPTEPFENMVKNAGFTSENHTVETKDGYILTLFRICKKSGKCNSGTPVLIVHGIVSSQYDWIMQDKDKALPYKLVKDGRDVWLAGNRGTTFSKKHSTYSTYDPRFWSFSHIEMGLYDVPAFLDKIKEVTSEDQVFYIGYSLGTKQYFSLMSEFPGNCSRIKAMWALAPVAYLNNQRSVPLKLLSAAIAPFGVGTSLLGGLEFVPSNEVVKKATSAFCASLIGCPICEEVLFTISGYNPDQVNPKWQPTQLGHFPDTTSTKTVIHNAQETFFNRFGYVDYGIVKNLLKYGAKYAWTPPQLKLSKIANNKKCNNIHLIYSEGDLLGNTKDVERLNKELGPAVKRLKKLKDIAHLDFLWGKDIATLVYNDILKDMRQYK